MQPQDMLCCLMTNADYTLFISGEHEEKTLPKCEFGDR